MNKIFYFIMVSMIAFSLHAGIIYNGQEYTETDMPFSQDGSGDKYFVFSGTVDNVNSWNMKNLTINGVDYTNTWSSSMPAPVDGKKYFVFYSPRNKFAHFEINGTNDWSGGGGGGEDDPEGIDTVAIDLPYEHNGADRVFLSTSGTINAVNSWGMDTLYINGVDYTNGWSDVMPARIDGMYYIYYASSQSYAHFEIDGNNHSVSPTEPDTINVSLPYTFDGVGHYYIITSDDIAAITSWETDSVSINGMVVTNQARSDIPEKIDGNYYIYYKGSQGGSHLEISKQESSADIINWNGNDYTFVEMPYAYSGGSVTRVYTYGKITSFSSNSKINSLEINGQSYAVNQTHTDSPASIDQKYYITITPKNGQGYFEINGETRQVKYNLNIKVLLQGALSGN